MHLSKLLTLRGLISFTWRPFDQAGDGEISSRTNAFRPAWGPGHTLERADNAFTQPPEIGDQKVLSKYFALLHL